MSDCMWEVGDPYTFVPTAYIGSSTGDNGTEKAKENIEKGKVKGTVIEVNEERRWYRVEWKPDHDRPQHECFKF